MKNKEYHNVVTDPKSNRKTKNTTMSEQIQNLTEKHFSVRFWICSDIVVFLVFLLDFGTVPTLWYTSLYHTSLPSIHGDRR
jgi:hypothetical protein